MAIDVLRPAAGELSVRRRQRLMRRHVSAPPVAELGIVIPFYNEERTAGPVVRELLTTLRRSNVAYELALVADGSTDATVAMLRDAAAGDPNVQIVCQPVAAGYGAAILRGVRLLDARIVGWTDGDGQVPPETVLAIHAAMARTGAPLGMGLRQRRRDGPGRIIASAGYNWLMRGTLGVSLPDVNAKPKLIEKRLLEEIAPRSEDWFIDTELVVGALVRGARVERVPVPFLARQHGASKVRASILREYWRNLRACRRRLRADGWLGRSPHVDWSPGHAPEGKEGRARPDE